MSGVKEKISLELKEALKSRDLPRLEALRFLQSAIKNREIELRPNPISDEDVLAVIKRLVKQRKESIEQYLAGGRNDLVEKEKAELAILESFLPQAIPLEQLQSLVDQTIQELQAKTLKDMGPVMKALIQKTQGAADNKVLSELIRMRLSPNA